MESLSFESKLHDIYDPSHTESEDDLEIIPKRPSIQKKQQPIPRETSQEKKFENLIERWVSSDEGSDYLVMKRNRVQSNGEENMWKDEDHFSIRDSFPGGFNFRKFELVKIIVIIFAQISLNTK